MTNLYACPVGRGRFSGAPLPRTSKWLAALASLMLLVSAPTVIAQSPSAATPRANAPAIGSLVARPEVAAPIIGFDDVRVGMRGYGLTVFSGTKIEPFEVVVTAVVPAESPKRGTFWIICDDERLDISGPVQGMSGSPIFLFDEGEAFVLGEGGRLAGAFAFGYSGVQYCLAGVQPIEYMRELATRVDPEAGAEALAMVAPQQAIAAARRAYNFAAPDTVGRHVAEWHLSILRAPLEPDFRTAPRMVAGPAGDAPVALMPMSVANGAIAQQFAPLFEPLGVSLVAGPGSTERDSGGTRGVGAIPMSGSTIAATPHPGIDASTTFIEPGSVLCVPMAWGDMDLTGNGTVTDVLPDGTVLAFGHAMDGIGDTAMPMASGYVHFVVPSRDISFKQAGSLTIQGTVSRDEMSGIAGVPELHFDTAPVSITIREEGRPDRDYAFEVLKHPMMSPPITGLLIGQSATVIHGPATRSTARMHLEATFSDGTTLAMEAASAPGNANALAQEIVPLIGAALANPFEKLTLDRVEATIDYETELDASEVLRTWVSDTSVEPGDTVQVHMMLQAYRGATRTLSITLTIPEDMPAGEYPIALVDRAGRIPMMIASQPQLVNADDLDSLMVTLQELVSGSPTALHAIIMAPQAGLTIGDQRLADLPGSRAAILSPGAGAAMPMQRLIEASVEANEVVSIQVPPLMITVTDPTAAND